MSPWCLALLGTRLEQRRLGEIPRGIRKQIAASRYEASWSSSISVIMLPLAERVGLPVKVDPAFDEDAPEGVRGAAAALLALAADGGSTVICSQGKVIPPLLRLLRPAGTGKVEDFETPKGTGWLLGIAGTTVVGADRLTP